MKASSAAAAAAAGGGSSRRRQQRAAACKGWGAGQQAGGEPHRGQAGGPHYTYDLRDVLLILAQLPYSHAHTHPCVPPPPTTTHRKHDLRDVLLILAQLQHRGALQIDFKLVTGLCVCLCGGGGTRGGWVGGRAGGCSRASHQPPPHPPSPPHRVPLAVLLVAQRGLGEGVDAAHGHALIPLVHLRMCGWWVGGWRGWGGG